MNVRFELKEIEKRDGVVHITITRYTPIAGSDVPSKGNVAWTNKISNNYWRYQDGKLFAIDSKAEWSEFRERNDETAVVLAAIKAEGYE